VFGFVNRFCDALAVVDAGRTELTVRSYKASVLFASAAHMLDHQEIE